MKVEEASSSPQTSKGSGAVVPKVSMFGVKFGFVIPKNKLSGSLVPSFRGAIKSGNINSVNGEKKEQAGRNTKWGPDLTQDAFVRKARLLAYQTRVDQISQLIKLNDLEPGVDQDVDMESLNMSMEFTNHEIDPEELKLERQEIIGEILKLNPSYKTPPDYVPLVKDERVPLPIKDYPGYNFLGLIYGSGSDTLKRLEKETGAKIQVFGTKKDSAEKVEITSDSKNNQDDYMELYTLISADTYDKVDAAVALVELLVTPVSAPSSTLPGSNAPILGQSSEVPSEIPNAEVAGIVQQLIRPTQVFPDQFQYNVPASIPKNTAQLPISRTKPGDVVHAVNNVPQTSEPFPYPSEPQQLMQFPAPAYVSDSNTFRPADPSRHAPVVAPHIFPPQPNLPNLHQFSGSHLTPLGLSSTVRQSGTSWQQFASDNPVRNQLNQDNSSIRWPIPSGPTQNSSVVGITSVPIQGHQNTAFGMPRTASFHSRPSTVLLASNMNQGAFTDTSVAHQQVRPYLSSSQDPSAATIPTQLMENSAMQSQLIGGPVTAAPQNSAYRPGAILPMQGSSASLPPNNQSSFFPARPSTGMVPRMQFPNSGEFVFRSQQLQNSAAMLNPWSGPRIHNYQPLEPTMQKPSDIRAPFFIPDFPNHLLRPFFRGNFRPHADDQYDRFQPHFADRHPSDVFSSPSFPEDHFGMRDTAFSHMRDIGINRPHQMANMHDSYILRPGNDFLLPARPGRKSLNSHPSSRQTFRPSRSQQAYDPFSPTAASTLHQQQDAGTSAKLNDQEMSNPES